MTLRSAQRDPYRGIGVSVEGLTIDEQIEKAGLDWSVEKSGYRYGPDGQYESKNNYIAYRSDTGFELGHYGNRRRAINNREVIENMHDFCERSNMNIKVNRIGCLRNGKSIFATAKLQHEIDILSVGDKIQTDLVIKEHHDIGATHVYLYENQLTCTNGQSRRVRVKGLSMVHSRKLNVSAIQSYLERATDTVVEHGQTMEHLAQVAIEDAEAKMLLVKQFGNVKLTWEDQPRPVKVAWNLYQGEGMGSEMMSRFNTLFGLSCAVSEYFSWYAKDCRTDVVLDGMIGGNRSKQINDFEKQLVKVAAM